MKFSVSPYVALCIVFASWAGRLQAYCAAIACILMHECAHALACDVLGFFPEGMTLHAFGASLHLKRELCTDPKAEAIASAAGPAASLVFGMAFYILYLWRNLEWFRLFYLYHTAFGLFNLLPALPMDGGRILRACLCRKWGSGRALVLSAYLGVAFGVLLCVCAVVAWQVYGINATLLCCGIAVILSAIREKKKESFFIIDAYQKFHVLEKGGILPICTLAVSEDTPLFEILKQLQAAQYARIEVYNGQMQKVGQSDEIKVAHAVAKFGKNASAKCLCGHLLR